MKIIEIKLSVSGQPTLTNDIKTKIEAASDKIGQAKLKELWKGQIPPREKTSIELAGTCVCLMDDWECTIFGKSYTDCIVGLSSLHTMLTTELKEQIGFKVLSPRGKEGTVYEMLKAERRKEVLAKIGIFISGAIAGGVLSYLIQLLLSSWFGGET